MTRNRRQVVLGVDIGGTFTDFVLVEAGELRVHKRLTTDDPAEGLLQGVRAMNVASDADVVHGSTIATNALLERRGARTALITTQGFADVLAIGRQNRPDLYALVPQRPEPLVPDAWRYEIKERITAEGEVRIPLDVADVGQAAEIIAGEGIEAVAVCLLYSFLYPEHERTVARILREKVDGITVSLSSEILPEYREYERTSTTVINAYVAPLMDRYLGRVEEGLAGRRLRIMQSNGGVITAKTAREEAARTALSGPAGGAVGAFHVAGLAGFNHIISFDMGGTSTDVALFPGEIMTTRETEIGGLPLRLPMVDVHTVGAGGGSIAQMDAGGALRVGPKSAGADPGPACYGRGSQPTTSDANALLGRLHPDYFLGGQMPLRVDRAREALTGLAVTMGERSAEAAALGILRVANATMERAIRRISVERGFDPRDFTLVAFGGAGPLHACALADELRIPRVLIPRTPGVLSALGMVIADLVKDYSQTLMAEGDVLETERLATIFEALARQATADLQAEGIAREEMSLERALDMRYKGQSHEITVSASDDGSWREAFHAAHDQRYGHRHDDEPLEIVTARLTAIGRGPKPAFEPLKQGGADPSGAQIGTNEVWYSGEEAVEAPFYSRDKLLAENEIRGPAVIFQLDATTVLPPGWVSVVDEWGNLIVEQISPQ